MEKYGLKNYYTCILDFQVRKTEQVAWRMFMDHRTIFKASIMFIYYPYNLLSQNVYSADKKFKEK